MAKAPNVHVRDRQTGHDYFVSEARFKRTPELWERLSAVPAKPRTTVNQAAAKKAAGRPSADQEQAPAPVAAGNTPEDVHPIPGGEEGHTSGHPADSNQEES